MSHAYAIQIEQPGDASALRVVEQRLSPPARGEVRLRHTAIGVNFVDIYHRRGLYPLPSWPAVPGVEAAGVVEALGEGVETLQPGQHVVYAGPPAGAYASARNVAAERVVALPDEVSDQQAASALLRGMTAHMLFTRVRPLAAGDTLLVHAAAGGLGQVLGQWGRALGARLIGTVGSADKARRARECGYADVIEYRQTDFVAAVLRLTAGGGVDYAIDGIGGDTLRRTLAAVRPFGLVASVGQVAGGADHVALAELGPARSIALARPGVFGFVRDIAGYREAAAATLKRLRDGLQVHVSARLPLREAAHAHRLLENGETAGAVILVP